MKFSTRTFGIITECLLTVFFLASCSGETLFERLPPERTGITFTNDITPDKQFNIINYTNMYNGGGVAVADFDNDGQQDLYFTGNMVANAMYLNRGDFRFDDVTGQAGVAGGNRWSSGVAAVDINSDGWMDLYVCATTYDDPEKRKNLLFVNQGLNEQNIPEFKEQASAYNLADTTNTTMAAFFDYDNDGDLDVYLLVNKFTRNSSMDSFHEKMTQGESVTTDRLYQNRGSDSLGHPYYKNVSREAGILMEGFGLGLNISDINKDGWKDIIVSNDFITNEVVYINNQDGTFTDRASDLFKHTVHAGMGNDVADINNDARPDIITLDMRPEDSYRKKMNLQELDYSTYQNNERYGYDYQYVRNQLQVNRGVNPNTGLPLFSEIGMFSGIAQTDWSWTANVADFDNDGWRDLMITNGFPKDIRDHDFATYIQKNYRYQPLEEILSKIPTIKLNNYAFKNQGNYTFEDQSEEWGLDTPSFSNGAVPVDLDNDGDLDYVVNNSNQTPFTYRNNLITDSAKPDDNHWLHVSLEGSSENPNGLGAIIQLYFGDGKTLYHEHTPYRGYLSSVDPVAHFGLGSHQQIDSLKVIWPDGSVTSEKNVAVNQTISISIKDAAGSYSFKEERRTATSRGKDVMVEEVTSSLGISYKHGESDFNDFGIQSLLPHKLSQYGPGLAVGDVQGDGLDDMFLTGSASKKGVILTQQKDGSFAQNDSIEYTNNNHQQEETGSLFFDADGDGDQDLYVVSGGNEFNRSHNAYQDRLFINDNGILRLAPDALPAFLSSGSAVRAADFDRDGDLDLFVAGRLVPHQYPKPADSFLLENRSTDSTVRFEIANDDKAAPLTKMGLISDAFWTDFNNDGWVDLVAAGEWMPIRFLRNEEGTLVDVSDQSGINTYKGWWNSLCAGDFDKDGDTDYVAGNLGLNTLFKAGFNQPVTIHAGDFDKNGVFDMILSRYMKGFDGKKKLYPVHGRKDMSQQIPDVRKIFPTHNAYATSTTDEILAKLDTTGMSVLEANYMQSSFIENKGGGKFDIKPLPDQAQWAPVFGCTAEDVNSDTNLDLLLVGNDYGMELGSGKHDAMNGLLLTGDGEGQFSPHPFGSSGFLVPGDGKALAKLIGSDGSLLLAATQNRGPLKLFKNSSLNRKVVRAKPFDAFAQITLSDGTVRKMELYHGSTFLSASAKFIPVTQEMISIEMTDFQGNSRVVYSRK